MQTGEKSFVTRAPRIGLGSSLSRSATANAAADPTRTAKTSIVGTYLAKSRRFYAEAAAGPGGIWYDFTL